MTSVAFASVSTTSTRRELDDDDGSQRRRRFGRRTGRRATRVASASDASSSAAAGPDVIRALLDRALEDGTRAREDVIDVGARERDGRARPGGRGETRRRGGDDVGDAVGGVDGVRCDIRERVRVKRVDSSDRRVRRNGGT